MVGRTVIFPLRPCADHYPGLAIEDVGVKAMALEAADPEWQGDTLSALVRDLYPDVSYTN